MIKNKQLSHGINLNRLALTAFFYSALFMMQEGGAVAAQTLIQIPESALTDDRPYEELGGGRNSAVPRTWLLEGRVISTKPVLTKLLDQNQEQVMIQIVHVFSGPSVLENQTFEQPLETASPFTSKIDGPPKAYVKDQRVIITLSRSPEWAGEPKQWVSKGFYGLINPVVIDGSKRAQEVEDHARRVESIYNSPEDKRKPLLMEYARGQFPITTVWATQTIARWTRSGSYKLLLELAQLPNRSVEQLATIDWELCATGPDQWRGAPERSTLLMSLARAPQKEGQGNRVLLALHNASLRGYRGEITNLRFLSFIKALIENSTTPLEIRQQAVKEVASYIDSGYGNQIDKSTALTFWIDLLKDSKKVVIVETVASEIAANAPWTPEQNQELKAVVTSLKAQNPVDLKIKNSLKNAIALLQKTIETPPPAVVTPTP